MKCCIEYCPFCERKINYYIRADGSCQYCNGDLSVVAVDEDEIVKNRERLRTETKEKEN